MDINYLIHSLPIPVVYFDLKERKVQISGQTELSFSNLKQNFEIQKKPWAECIISELSESVENLQDCQVWLKSMAQQNLNILNKIIQFKNGAYFRMHGIVIKNEGNSPIAIYLKFMNTTETIQQAKENELNKLKMIELARLSSLGELAASISHEINNPLSIIVAKASITQTFLKTGRLNDTILDENMEKIKNVSSRISKIVAGLKAFARNETQDIEKVIDISELIEETLFFCKDRVNRTKTELLFNEFPKAKIRCRPIQISQVLINLINNATDANDDIAIDPDDRKIHLEITKQKNFLIIAVTNPGPQIPIEIHEKIFQPFFTTKPSGKGTGLGLSISKRIMSDHGGELFFDTNHPSPRFIVKIPLLETDAIL
jgi:C4-dicarboxylate-specific signal transduction histidine kinase